MPAGPVSGTVPSLKGNEIPSDDPGGIAFPVAGSTRAKVTPGGTGKSCAGACCSAFPMNCIHIGRATAAADWRFPRGFGVSKPIHTPARTSGEKPMNQASVFSLVVPVFPARE
ncbi:MAG: hypothetical protein HW408_1084, partial [Actinobacteria bacterium]|nr:hypothetical protein [Actinomycetota bacterium]